MHSAYPPPTDARRDTHAKTSSDIHSLCPRPASRVGEPTASPTDGPVRRKRPENVGVVNRVQAPAWGFTGATARASGWPTDRRVTHPYDSHPERAPSVPAADRGDSPARHPRRPEEMAESPRITSQAPRCLSPGQAPVATTQADRRTRKTGTEAITTHPRSIHEPTRYEPPTPHAGAEAPKGELGPLAVVTHPTRSMRFKTRPPGYLHSQPLHWPSKGPQPPDLVTVTGTSDPVPGEIDRGEQPRRWSGC
jgi:NADH-quinone oxidoreductase subunit D